MVLEYTFTIVTTMSSRFLGNFCQSLIRAQWEKSPIQFIIYSLGYSFNDRPIYRVYFSFINISVTDFQIMCSECLTVSALYDDQKSSESVPNHFHESTLLPWSGLFRRSVA